MSDEPAVSDGPAANHKPAAAGFHTLARSQTTGNQRPHMGHQVPHLVDVLGERNPVTVRGERDARIAAVAELQRGRISRRQLHAIDVPGSTITRLITAGRLTRVHFGVYALRPVVPIPLGREAGALLACGTNALLSHRSAAALWGLCDAPDGPVEVTVPVRRRRKHPGIRTYRSGLLSPRDVRLKDGLPVTSPARTLLDQAQTRTSHELERQLDEALNVLRIVTPDELEDVLTRARGRRGTSRLRRLLASRVAETITQSEAERLFLRLVRRAGLPEPETQVRIRGFSVDFLWRPQRVVFEIDGYRFHTSRSAFDRDRRKDLALRAAGFDPYRVSRDQVKYEPLVVLAYAAGALARSDETSSPPATIDP